MYLLIKNSHQRKSTTTPSKLGDKQLETREEDKEEDESPTREDDVEEKTGYKENQAGHFLEVFRLFKAEIISSMNAQIATLSNQIKEIQQVQARQMVPLHMTYYQPGMIPQSQLDNQLLFTPQPQGTQNQLPIQMHMSQRMQTPFPNRVQTQNQN